MFNRSKFIDKFRNGQPRLGKVKLKENCWKLPDGVLLYNTKIVVWTPNVSKVCLYTGGYLTISTKSAINATLTAMGIDATVLQRKGQWIVETNGTTIEFTEGMSV